MCVFFHLRMHSHSVCRVIRPNTPIHLLPLAKMSTTTRPLRVVDLVQERTSDDKDTEYLCRHSNGTYKWCSREELPRAKLRLLVDRWKAGIVKWDEIKRARFQRPAKLRKAVTRRYKGMSKKEAELYVFSKYFLPSFKQQLCNGWQVRSTLTGKVRHGCATFFPPVAYEALLRDHGQYHETAVLCHHTFLHPRDVPEAFVAVKQQEEQHPFWGAVTQSWWRKERDSGLSFLHPGSGELVAQRELFIVCSPVVFHYHPKRHRMSVSFSYSRAVRDCINLAWVTQVGANVNLL